MSPGPSLSTVIAQAALRHDERPCLSHAGRRWTFSEFHGQVDALARALSERFAKGARVALFMRNCPEYLMLQFAVERAGLVRASLNARSTFHEACVLLQDSGAEALFHDSATRDRALQAVAGLPQIWSCQVDSPDPRDASAWRDLCAGGNGPLPVPGPDDVCSINYTSGSSGQPKGVVLTHRNYLAMYGNMLADRDLRTDDVLAHIGPLTHASGTYFVAGFLKGVHSVLVEDGTVDKLIEAITRERVTLFTCVPTVLTRIVNHPDIDRCDLSSLRAIGYGGEPIPFNTLEKALRRFGPILTQNYGLTEAPMTVTYLRPEEYFGPPAADGSRPLRVDCIGRPYTFVEVVLRAPDGRPVAAGEIGEITVRSEHVMAGYWNRPEETGRVLRDGWLWTGDLATRDAQGLLTLAGRSKEMLISGGYNIYPQEVEAVLTSHPRVMEAAVIGVADPDWGEIAVAFVSGAPSGNLAIPELQEYCKSLLGFKTPKRFHVLDTLPKTGNGKVDKQKLKADVREGSFHG